MRGECGWGVEVGGLLFQEGETVLYGQEERVGPEKEGVIWCHLLQRFQLFIGHFFLLSCHVSVSGFFVKE